MDLVSRIQALIDLGKKSKATAIQIYASQPAARSNTDELVTTKPLEPATLAEGLADQIAQEMLDELEERSGAVRFRAKITKAGAEIARETIRLDGRAAPVQGLNIVRGSNGQAQLMPNGAGDARTQLTTDDLVLPDGAMTGTASTAVVLAVLRMQMNFNRDLSRDYLALAGQSHKPLLDQNSMLGDALGKANAVIITSAEAHRDAIRQTRVLEAEAKTEERKAAAIEKAGEMLAKYLPAALARISRKFGIVAADEETDPLLEKLVGSFKSSQMAQLQKILEPEQITLFADVWQAMDDRKGKKGKKKPGAPHPWAPVLPSIEKLLRSLTVVQLGALSLGLTPDQMKWLDEIQATAKLVPQLPANTESAPAASSSSSAPSSNGNGASSHGNGSASGVVVAAKGAA